MESLEMLKIQQSEPLSSVMQKIDANAKGFVCVVNEQDVLVGSVTDGDIRRAILKGLELTTKCSDIMNKLPKYREKGISNTKALEFLKKHDLRSLPIVNKKKKLVEVLFLKKLIADSNEEKIAVVLAGGEGKRLRPFTESIPKPMLEVHGKPMLEHIIERLQSFGITKIFLSVNYLSNIIEDYFKDGSKFGVQIEYIREDKKLGTAGPLAQLPVDIKGPIVVLNGDIITKANFQSMLDYHHDDQADFTVGASVHKVKIPYGVLSLKGEKVTNLKEKPVESFFCSAGIYIISKNILRLIPSDSFFDIPELIELLISRKYKVRAFPIHEKWADVGKEADLIAIRNDKI